MSAKRILVVSSEPLGQQMAGPALRVRAIEATLSNAGHRVVTADLRTVHAVEIDSLDMAVTQGGVLRDLPDLVASEIPIVVDLYDPFHLEALHRGGDDRVRRLDLLEGSLDNLRQQLARGDFFLCASRSQRHLWLGHLASAGRLNPATHEQDPAFRALLALAPFGVDRQPFAPAGAITDHLPAATGSPILLWAGGLHDWLDPLTVIEAMPSIRKYHPDAQLILLGGRHPNSAGGTSTMVTRARRRAESLGLDEAAVIVHDGWIAGDDRADLLYAADLGVLAQPDHVETEFSFRTRLLDHLWTGLPTVSTVGDDLSREFAVHGAGRVVPSADPEGFADACVALLEPGPNQAARVQAQDRATHHQWDDALVPLLAFADNPSTAPDRSDPAIRRMIDSISASSQTDLTSPLARAQRHLDVGGPRELVEQSLGVLRRRFDELRGR